MDTIDKTTSGSSHGVYVSLQDLARLRHSGRSLSFLPKQPVHSVLAGQKASKLRGRGLNFEEIRAYLPGDDIRNMDWKATARTGEPHMRVFSEERDRPVLFVVDQRISMFFGSRAAMKSVRAAETAAVGAWRVVHVGDRVGAVVFNDSDIVEVRPRRSSKTVMQILHTLVDFNGRLNARTATASKPEQLNEVLRRVVSIATHDFLVILITDLQGGDATTKELMTRLARHNDAMVGFVFDPMEQKLPNKGRLLVSDGDKQLEFDSSDHDLRVRYEEEFAERIGLARSVLLQRQIPVLQIVTNRPVNIQLREQLGQAARTRSRKV